MSVHHHNPHHPAPAFRFIADAQPSRIHWLWPARIPLGTVSLLIGDPGVGKSLLTADLAARLSAPMPWPDDPTTPTDDSPPSPVPSNISPDTQSAYTPTSRRGFPTQHLAPAGADPHHISLIDGVTLPHSPDPLPLRLPTHADQLDQAIAAHDHPRLVILDPVHLLLDHGVFSNADRQADLLGRLADIAQRRGVAILAVGHFTKTGSRRVIYRIRGSLSLTAAARSILLLTHDPDTPNRRILTQIKNTHAPLAPPITFRIATTPAVPEQSSAPQSEPRPPGHGPSSLPRPQGRGSYSPCTAESAPRLDWFAPTAPDPRLAAAALDLTPESYSVLSETCDWLTDLLSAGPRPAREVLTAARAAAIPRSTLFRAKRILNIPSQKTGPTWTWLPPPTPPT